jgi:serine/threonine protein kinase
LSHCSIISSRLGAVISQLSRGARLLIKNDQPASLVGRRIGQYELLSEIGHGGMGVVYRAARADQQFKKQVAVKLVKLGLDSDEMRRRFGHERQILANIDHPNIAKLLDAGTTGDGRPYLVMDYVEGVSVLQYCDQHRLPINARLRLFLDVAPLSHMHIKSCCSS